MFKQTKRHSKTFSCGYVYHIKVKIPVGYVTLTVVTGLLFEITIVYFSLLSFLVQKHIQTC